MMDASAPQELSCKACHFTTSRLLDFMNHVRKAHYERHTSKTDLRLEKDLLDSITKPDTHESGTMPQPAEAERTLPPLDHTPVKDTADIHKAAGASGIASPYHNTRPSNSYSNTTTLEKRYDSIDNSSEEPCLQNRGQHSIKHEKDDTDRGFYMINTDCDNRDESCKENETNDIAAVLCDLSRNSFVKIERDAERVPDRISESNANAPTAAPPFPNKKNDNTPKTLGINYGPERNPGTSLFRAPTPNQTFYPNTDNAACNMRSDSDSVQNRFVAPPQTTPEHPGYFLRNKTSVPPFLNTTGVSNKPYTMCYDDRPFQPFVQGAGKQVFPNAPHRYPAGTGNVAPQQNYAYGRDVTFSKGASLFDASGGFLPSFHALMCAGFVTMPQTQVLQSVKCDRNKWEYIQQTLHNAFRKFPYLTAPEVQILSNLTELTCQQVKTLFVVARLQHGISWDQEEIQNARNYLRIPRNRFSGEG